MTGPTPSIDGTTSSQRALLGGCTALLAVAAVGVALVLWLWSTLSGPAADDPRTEPSRSRTEPSRSRTEPSRSRTEPSRSRTEPGSLTRSEREALERELRELERELEHARGQARLTIDPGARAGWRERMDELAARRDEIESRLGR